jgi:hypothetical protein
MARFMCMLTCQCTVVCLPACSYEHFYVVYCKFWELDSDHDFSLDKGDLARYNNCALTYQIVERIFEEVGAPAYVTLYIRFEFACTVLFRTDVRAQARAGAECWGFACGAGALV